MARNVECSESPDPIKTGPKVYEIISCFSCQKHGWHALVEEYHGDAALRRKEDLAKGQPEPVKRTLGEPAS